MPNSAAETAVLESPENILTFDEWKDQSKFHGLAHPDSLVGKVTNFFDGYGTQMLREYQTYLNNINNRNEAKAVQSARAWDEYMSNTAYSRAFEDLKKSGINPYLLLNSGSSPSTSVGSSSKASYSSKSLQETQSNNKGRDLALIMLAIARLAAAL